MQKRYAELIGGGRGSAIGLGARFRARRDGLAAALIVTRTYRLWQGGSSIRTNVFHVCFNNTIRCQLAVDATEPFFLQP